MNYSMTYKFHGGPIDGETRTYHGLYYEDGRLTLPAPCGEYRGRNGKMEWWQRVPLTSEDIAAYDREWDEWFNGGQEGLEPTPDRTYRYAADEPYEDGAALAVWPSA